MAVQITGLREFVRGCKAVDATFPKQIRDINKECAEIVAVTARTLAPYRSGRLRGNIRAGATLTAGTVSVGSQSVPYAGPIHWGWPRHHIKPNPFLVKALEGDVGKIEEKYNRDLQAFLDRNF